MSRPGVPATRRLRRRTAFARPARRRPPTWESGSVSSVLPRSAAPHPTSRMGCERLLRTGPCGTDDDAPPCGARTRPRLRAAVMLHRVRRHGAFGSLQTLRRRRCGPIRSRCCARPPKRSSTARRHVAMARRPRDRSTSAVPRGRPSVSPPASNAPRFHGASASADATKARQPGRRTESRSPRATQAPLTGHTLPGATQAPWLPARRSPRRPEGQHDDTRGTSAGSDGKTSSPTRRPEARGWGASSQSSDRRRTTTTDVAAGVILEVPPRARRLTRPNGWSTV